MTPSNLPSTAPMGLVPRSYFLQRLWLALALSLVANGGLTQETPDFASRPAPRPAPNLQTPKQLKEQTDAAQRAEKAAAEANAKAGRERIVREKAEALARDKEKALQAAQTQSAKDKAEIARLQKTLNSKPAQTSAPIAAAPKVSALATPLPPPAAASTSAAAPLDLEVRPAFPGGPAMVTLPASLGGFLMGSKEYDGEKDNKGGPHKVTLPYRLEMGQTEVTVGQYLQCVADKACQEPEWREAGSKYHYQTGSDQGYSKFGAAVTGANQPIVGVSWHNAQQYANWVSQKTGLAHLPANDPRRYRLPTHAEWKYAASAGRSARWSDDDFAMLMEFAWYSANSDGQPHAVATRDANKWNLFDMVGNVWEWMEDCTVGGKSITAINDIAGGRPDDNSCSRVARGGAWNTIPLLFGAISYGSAAGTSSGGFRIARTLLP